MTIPSLTELRAMRAMIAAAAIDNVEFLPIFERVDRDCADAEIFASSDPVAILRAQIEKGRREAA